MIIQEIDDYLETIKNESASKKIFELNKYLVKYKTNKDNEKKNNLSSSLSKIPINLTSNSINLYEKHECEDKDYIKYLESLRSEGNNIDIDDKYFKKNKNLEIKILYEDVEDVINNAQNDSKDEYGLNISDLSNYAEIYIILVKLYNEILSEKNLCEEWRTITIKTKYKGGDKNDPKNFRPINKLPILIRLFDNILARKIKKNVLENELIDFQIQKALTLTGNSGLFEAIFEINSNLDKSILFLDIKNAYGSVNYETLLKILEKHNFDKTLIDYYREFYGKLIGKYNDIKFSWKNGLLQSINSSNILFLLYIDICLKELKNNLGDNYIVISFVDDISIIIKKLEKKIKEILENTLLKYNFLINIEKTYEFNNPNFIFINNIKNDFKYLGSPLIIYYSQIIDQMKKKLNTLRDSEYSSELKILYFFTKLKPYIQKNIELCLIENKSYPKLKDFSQQISEFLLENIYNSEYTFNQSLLIEIYNNLLIKIDKYPNLNNILNVLKRNGKYLKIKEYNNYIIYTGFKDICGIYYRNYYEKNKDKVIDECKKLKKNKNKKCFYDFA